MRARDHRGLYVIRNDDTARLRNEALGDLSQKVGQIMAAQTKSEAAQKKMGAQLEALAPIAKAAKWAPVIRWTALALSGLSLPMATWALAAAQEHAVDRERLERQEATNEDQEARLRSVEEVVTATKAVLERVERQLDRLEER